MTAPNKVTESPTFEYQSVLVPCTWTATTCCGAELPADAFSGGKAVYQIVPRPRIVTCPRCGAPCGFVVVAPSKGLLAWMPA